MFIYWPQLFITCYLNMALQSKEQWTVHFFNLNIPHDISEQYATIFYTNRMTEAVPIDATAAELHQLCIEVFGEIKTILYHAQSTNTNPKTSSTTNPAHASSNHPCQYDTTPILQILNQLDCLQWITNLPENQLQAQLYNACDDTVQNILVNNVSDFFALAKDNFLHTLEDIAAKKANPVLNWLTFSSLF